MSYYRNPRKHLRELAQSRVALRLYLLLIAVLFMSALFAVIEVSRDKSEPGYNPAILTPLEKQSGNNS